MSNETLVIEIYNNTINDILLDVKQEYIDELRQSYMNYLKDMYLSFDLKNTNKDVNKVLNLLIKLERAKWEITSANNRLTKLLEDKALDNIIRISSEGYNYARNRIEKNFGLNEGNNCPPTLDKDLAKKNINMLNNYLHQVREFNKDEAAYYVSEGTLDFQYASGEVEVTSLRVGRIR